MLQQLSSTIDQIQFTSVYLSIILRVSVFEYCCCDNRKLSSYVDSDDEGRFQFQFLFITYILIINNIYVYSTIYIYVVIILFSEQVMYTVHAVSHSL